MSNENFSQDNKDRVSAKNTQKPAERAEALPVETSAQKVRRIQRELGNRAIQRVLAQREGGPDGGLAVDEDTQARINSQRSSGQPLDVGVQQRMQAAIGYDFSGVRVHHSAEASGLSQTLQAKAFTTGSDIFFNEGAYQPQSSGGQELIAHELTHVVQQGSGQVPSSSGGMTVNAPNDAFEQQADATAHQAMTSAAPASPASVQRETDPQEEHVLQQSALQREAMPAEDELPVQAKGFDARVQRAGLPQEEEQAVQMQELDEDPQEEGL